MPSFGLLVKTVDYGFIVLEFMFWITGSGFLALDPLCMIACARFVILDSWFRVPRAWIAGFEYIEREREREKERERERERERDRSLV